MLAIAQQAEGVGGVIAPIAVFTGIGDAIEILAGREVRGEKGRVLIPRGMLEIVICSRRSIHGGQRCVRVWVCVYVSV